MVDMADFAQAFGLDSKSPDTWTTLGKVTAVSGTTLTVKLGGSSSTTTCEAYCLAAVDDIVFVVITDGKARAVAVKGGEDLLLDSNYEIRRSYVDSTAANNSVSNNSYVYYKFGDKNGLFTGWVGNVAVTDGMIQTQLAARKKVNGSNVDNVLYLDVDKDGNRIVAMTDPALWVSALKLNTWTSVTAANWYTPGTGFANNANTTVKYNAALGIVQVRLQVQATSAISAGYHTIGSVASSYRPASVRVALPSLTSASYPAYIDTNGNITANTAAVSQNGYLYYCGEYHIGG